MLESAGRSEFLHGFSRILTNSILITRPDNKLWFIRLEHVSRRLAGEIDMTKIPSEEKGHVIYSKRRELIVTMSV